MKIKKHNSSISNSKQKDKKTPKILGLGLIKLDFYLNVTEETIKRHSLDLSKINSPKDLVFIAENIDLLDLVQISTTDTLSNILLYLNKANVQKSFVELITLNPLRFKPEEEHMRKIFSHVTEHNYLFTNEMNVATTPNKVSFAIKSGKKLLKYWDIVADYDPFAEEIKKEDNILINKSLREERDAIKEEDEKVEADNIGKNLHTTSNLNLSQNEKNNNNENNLSKNNNYENFNNNENSRINMDENVQNSNSYNEDYDNLNKEMMDKEENMEAHKNEIDILENGNFNKFIYLKILIFSIEYKIFFHKYKKIFVNFSLIHIAYS